MPAVIAPSPIIATCFSGLATAIPRAALIEVLECPAPKESYSLSSMLVKGCKPPLDLIVCMSFFFQLKFYEDKFGDLHPRLNYLQAY